MILRILLSIFFIAHGLVHLLYFAHSQRYFELAPGLAWPDRALLFSGWLGDEAIRRLAGLLLVLAAAAFTIGGGALLVRQGWWRWLVSGAAVVSILLYLAFWDGGLNRLPDKGGVGILINLGILAALLVFHWPAIDF